MMVSTASKPDTLRRAKAQAVVKMAPRSMERLLANDLPKPDVLATARVAGMLACKQTPLLLPHCHPLSISEVSLDFETGVDMLTIFAEVTCVAPTGVEMEALTAASVAALTVYDLLKPIDKALEISHVKLLEKSGGKTDFQETLPPSYRAAVITASDRSFHGKREDKSGPYVIGRLKAWGVPEPDYALLPDDKEAIAEAVRSRCDQGFHLVMVTGGTGLSPRDVTVEAITPLLDRILPGVMEAARSFGQRRTPYAMLSRAVAGQRGKTLVITLPGSSGGCRDALDSLYPALFHAHEIMAGGTKGHKEGPA